MSDARRRRGVWARARELALAVCLGSLTAACASGGARPTPPPAPALEAYARATDAARALATGAAADPAARRAALEDAVDAAPDWIPPARELDELERAELRGHLAWDRRRTAAAAEGATAADLYLLGRLEGAEGTDELRAALRRDPDCAWAHHALSVDAELRGRLREALAAERRAESLGPSAFERAQFGRRVLDLERRLELDEEGAEHALALVRELSEALPRSAQVPLALAAARAELESDDPARRERGLERGLDLLATSRLTDGELFGLLSDLERAADGRSRRALNARVRRALLAGPRAPSLDEPASVLGRDPGLLRFAVLEGRAEPSPDALLAAALASGRAADGARGWLAAQPRVALDADGLPRDRRLRAWVELALAHETLDDAARFELAEALLDAGWQDAAEPLIAALTESARRGDGPPAEAVAALAVRAEAIRAVVDELELLVAALFDGRRSLALTPARASGGYADRPGGTRGVLEAVQRVLRVHGPHAGLSADTIEAVDDSPLLRFGPFASVVVPGPRFGRRDALYGVGTAGEPVPGLAAAMDALGRFALFGAGLGRAPDGTVLRRLWAEERAGSHLGVPWRGTLVWCAGADADGARSRGSGLVSGAALHEGYWLDVEAERARLARYRRLAERFPVGGDRPAPLTLAPPRVDAALEGAARRAERRRSVPALGQADRVALALLHERAVALPDGATTEELVTLEDLLDVVETHEEGHLCDRERFLPLGRDLLGALGLGLREWLLGDLGLERRLEYRAQAVALACADEPRLALIDLLDAAEVDTRLETVHARAYRALLERFLEVLDAELAADPGRFPALDPGAYLLYQLDRLSADQVRAVALALADAEGLVADGWEPPAR